MARSAGRGALLHAGRRSARKLYQSCKLHQQRIRTQSRAGRGGKESHAIGIFGLRDSLISANTYLPSNGRCNFLATLRISGRNSSARLLVAKPVSAIALRLIPWEISA